MAATEGRGPGQTGASRPLRLLVFSASLRADSLNTRLATRAAATIEAQGHTTDVASMSEFDASTGCRAIVHSP